MYLRITSDGTNLTASASGDGQTFTPVGRSAALAGITNPRIGVFALNGGTEAPVVDAAFDSFQVTPDAPAGPVDPSDEFTGSTLDKCRWDADHAGGPERLPGHRWRAADRRAQR